MRTGRPKQPSVLSDDKRNRVGLETGGRTAASTSARKSLAGLESRCTVVQTNRRIRPDQILVGHSACRYPTKGTGALGQTPLDHRARFPGIEVRTWFRPPRRTWMARFSSSRHLMYRGLWIPGGRTESCFPSARAGHLGLQVSEQPPDLRPRGSPRSSRAA